MIIAAIIIGVFVAIILLPFIAIWLMVSNRRTLKKMQELVDQYLCLSPADRDANRANFKYEMTRLKAKVSTMDKQSTERARDLLAII
jgi:hypothetical protein